MKIIYLLLVLLSSNVWASFKRPSISTFDWDGIKVVYLEEKHIPLYNVIFYFSDGSLSDEGSVKGETNAMFSMLDMGTRRFSKKDIQDNLEFFGVNYSAGVTHEYSTFSFNGLIKDIIPTTKKICHLFSDAVFPDAELNKEKTKYRNGLVNLVSSPQSLATRAFRELSLKETPYHYPVEGKLNDIKRLNRSGLQKKLKYFNEKVNKRIYISGPKSALEIKSIVLNECSWNLKDAKYVRSKPLDKNLVPKNNNDIHLITIPNANQAQVMIGRFLTPKEFEDEELLDLSSGFLGGGFTSQLMRAVRVERGLTYGISSFAAGQKEYGRSGISTSTRNQSVPELLNVIKETIDKINNHDFKNEAFERARGYLVGSYPFRFESKSAFLGQLQYLDHVGKSYDEFFDYQDNIKSFTKEEVAKKVGEIFGWEKQTIVILGNKSLLKDLKKLGNVKVYNYQRFL